MIDSIRFNIYSVVCGFGCVVGDYSCSVGVSMVVSRNSGVVSGVSG